MANKNNDLALYKMDVNITLSLTQKYRRKIIYNHQKVGIRDILKQLCPYKGCGNNRRTSYARSYSYVDKYSAKNIAFHHLWISKRKIW